MTANALIKYIDNIKQNDNNYGDIFVKHLSKNIFSIDLSKLSSIDTSIDESKINNKNYIQLKNKLKKLIVSIDIKTYIDNMNENLLTIDKPSNNNNVLLFQIFHYINYIYTQDKEILILLLINFNNNLYSKTPSNGTSNKLRTRRHNDSNNFKKYIFEDIYDTFWQSNYDDKLIFYNFVKSFDDDIIYIKMISSINQHFLVKGASKINKLSLYLTSYLRQNIKLNIYNTLNFLSTSYNQDSNINQFIIEYFQLKNSEEYDSILKIINCYKNIRPQVEDNKYLFLIYCQIQIENIINKMDDTQITLFSKLFYKNLENYWLKNITSPIFFNETSDYLYDFRSWNMTNEQYNETIDIINETNIQINIQINKLNKIKQKKTNSKTVSISLKSKAWNKYIGKEKGISKCLCCDNNDISQMDFECGHIIAKTNGGKNILKNVRPICGMCNKSMGSKHMFDFMDENGFKKDKIM
jgi:hypothetical protein